MVSASPLAPPTIDTEPLVLGVFPASVLPIVVTLLCMPGAMACSVLPMRFGVCLGKS
jgi:hypothetical protein